MLQRSTTNWPAAAAGRFFGSLVEQLLSKGIDAAELVKRTTRATA
jgi:hypothetical protein